MLKALHKSKCAGLKNESIFVTDICIKFGTLLKRVQVIRFNIYLCISFPSMELLILNHSK